VTDVSAGALIADSRIALHLFEQRARNPDMSGHVVEALLVLAQEGRTQGDSQGAADLRRAQSCLNTPVARAKR